MGKIEALAIQCRNEVLDGLDLDGPNCAIDWRQNAESELGEILHRAVRGVVPDEPNRDWVLGFLRERPDLLDGFLYDIGTVIYGEIATAAWRDLSSTAVIVKERQAAMQASGPK